MTIDIVAKDLLRQQPDLIVVGMFAGTKRLADDAARLDEIFEGHVAAMIEREGFEAKLGQTMVFPSFGKTTAPSIAVIGLGEKKTFSLDAARRIGGQLVKLGERVHATRLATTILGAGAADLDAGNIAGAIAEGAWLGAYRFHAFHGTKRRAETKPQTLQTITMCEMDARIVKKAKEAVEVADVLAEATNLARDLVNTPSSHMTPSQLADAARSVVEGSSTMSMTQLDRAAMESLGMHAALAVGRGSMHEPVGVHLTYKPRGAKKKIAIVGKAVTFDSGGLSIKPADGMMTMKIDMAGAATVIGLFAALRKRKVPVEVHGIFLAVENMPAGNAYRPGDVVTAMNGMTIEILNTDAEGRVTLADALSYAAQQQPDAIIDLATLTGAMVVALGEEVAGLFCSNAKLAERLKRASEVTGEWIWEMPLVESYNDHIKSKIADLKNIGQRGSAGSISAALFLKPFANGIPWAHLDIAGTCYTEKESRPDQPYGASGYGVRLLVEYLERL